MTRRVELVRKKKFATAILDLNHKTFIIYIAFLAPGSEVNLFCRSQIAFLKTDETSTFVLFEYTNFVDVFSKDLVAKLLEYTKINNYPIDLVED